MSTLVAFKSIEATEAIRAEVLTDRHQYLHDININAHIRELAHTANTDPCVTVMK